MNEFTKSQKYQERVKILTEQHGWKLQVPPSVLDPEDRAGLGGGLKCFKEVFDRKDDGSKLETKHRCGNPARKGSFFCKKHGGANQHALKKGEHSMTSSAYRGALKADLGALFDAFLNDPTLLDLKPELAAMKMCFRAYMDKVSGHSKKIERPKKALEYIVGVLNEDGKLLNDVEKFERIQMFCANQSVLTDGECLDRISRMTECIGKLVDRIEKTQIKDEFMLTMDGIKILYRCIIDIVRENADEKTLKRIKEGLISINVRTQGDLTRYNQKPEVEEAKFKLL